MANFRTRARAVDLLGKQQIRDEITAISELLRNAYDADADVGLVDVDTSKNRIIIWDDGDGMNREDILNNWLTLGTYSKKTKKIIKTRKGRIKIGEKGIGRLAISLLGDHLLLVSKKKYDVNNERWALLYLHWSLFRNENLYLEDIDIPVMEFIDVDHIINFLKEEFQKAKFSLIKNFNQIELWDKDEYNSIINDIENFEINNEIVTKIRQIERNGGGTMFYVDKIERTWDWDNYYNSSVQEDNLVKKEKRLKDLLFSFKNPIDFFDSQIKESDYDKVSRSEEDDEFKPKIHINNTEMENKEALNSDDVGVFDYALKGVIKNGEFNGNAFIGYNNNIPQLLNVPKDRLTQGIADIKDCGPIKIKWFFVEGLSSISSIPEHKHKEITDKLDKIGGIYVYRDGLRILPYGEEDNDFLGIEKRRTQRAGTYLFSYRRMYGYIEISKEYNEKLMDKSSREGFIENEYFNYFRTVLVNLLIWWAVDYLETKSDTGKRSKHIEKSKIESEFQKKREAEKKEEKKYFIKLEKWISNYDTNRKTQEKKVRNRIDRLINNIEDSESINESILTKIRLDIYHIIEEFEDEKWKLNYRYEHENEIREVIENYNDEINILKMNISNHVNEIINEISEQRKLKRDKQNKNNKSHWLLEDINEKINRLKISYIDEINIVERESKSYIDDQVKKITNILVRVLRDELQFQKERHFNNKADQIATLEFELNQLKNEVEISGFSESKVNEKISTLFEKYDYINQEIRDLLIQYRDSTKNGSLINELNKVINNFIEIIENQEKWNYDQILIGKLKTELTTYRDLSALGLATELTDHEFNSVYAKIKEGLNKLSKALVTTRLVPILNNVSTGFKSLEKLHERMSPLYRQSRNRKVEINMRTYIDNLLEFFSSDIHRYNVKIHNNIPENFIVREAEVVFFTPFINIISNALYWMLNKDTKEIHFYVSKDKSRLYIQDTGPGINIRDIERVFDPFFSKKTNGRGLGLFLSKDILNSKGHDLSLEIDNNQSSGACFYIEFNENTIMGV